MTLYSQDVRAIKKTIRRKFKMPQLPLPLAQRIVFERTNFISHGGVSKIIEGISETVFKNAFSLSVVEGAAGFGKSHLAVFLAGTLLERGLEVSLVDGTDNSELFQNRRVLLIDDADQILSQMVKKHSGPFVDLVERRRIAKQAIVVFSQPSLLELGFDDHVLSRLRAGIWHQIQAPKEEEVPAVISALARQRGIELSKEQISFLARRLDRSMPGMVAALDELVGTFEKIGSRRSLPL